MLNLSGTNTTMPWSPVYATLKAMIGFKPAYISEQSVPTNLNTMLLAGWTF